MDVGAPERVDRLLRIPDQDQAPRRGARLAGRLPMPDPAKDLVLHRIRVLELVDQREAELLPQPVGETSALGSTQRVAKGDQQVVEDELMALVAAAAGLLARRLDHRSSQGERARVVGRLDRARRMPHRLERLEDGIFERLVPLLHAAREALRSELGPPIGQGEAERRGAGVGLDQRVAPIVEAGDPCLLERLLLVDAPARRVALEQPRQDALAPFAPGPRPGHAIAVAGPAPLGDVVHGRLERLRRGQDRHLLVGAQPIEQTALQLVGRELPATPPALEQPLDEVGVGPGERAGPEVPGQRVSQPVGRLDQLRVEGGAALEGVALEASLAEAVDREDGRLVELAQRATQGVGAAALLGAAPCVERECPQPDLLFLEPGPGRLAQRDGLPDPLAHALPELRRRGLGVGHDQDLCGREVLLDQ